MSKRKLQLGDIVKVVHDETGELQDCVGVVVDVAIVRDEENSDPATIEEITVAFGEGREADNTTLFEFINPPVWAACFNRKDLRYCPKLSPSPIRCVPE